MFANPNFAPALVAVAVFSIPLAAVIGAFWHRTVKTKSEAELKRLLIEQGRSADEIERILAAPVGKGERSTTAASKE